MSEIENEKQPEFKVTVRRSEDVKDLLKALITARKEFGPVVRNLENEAYKRGGKASKYADLATVMDATEPALLKNGLVMVQHVQGHHITRETVVTTTLFHESGQFLESDLSVPSVNQQGRFDPQTVASASTYARRYAWQGITGTAPEDDDGNKASGIGTREEAQAVGKAKVSELKGKLGKSPANGTEALFYTLPEAHNGHFAEFINVKAYGSSLDQVAQEGLRALFTKYAAKITKDETILVSTSKLDSLLEVLAGDAGITVKQLEAR